MRWKLPVLIAMIVIILGTAAFFYFHSNYQKQTSSQNLGNSQSPNISQNLQPQTLTNGEKVYTDRQLLAMASSYNASEGLSLGDGKYKTSGPQKGYVYYCNTPTATGGGAEGKAPWIINNLWYPSQKPHVLGDITWNNAALLEIINGTRRFLIGNGLPLNLGTGIFPIQKTDPAYQYDANPNSIKPHNVTLEIPLNPVYSKTPNCMRQGGEIGVMLTGVVLFDAMDADQRDAVAHEVQDSCDAHPQEAGIYHYHSISPCFTNISEKHILGYAIDGFPITGPEVAPGKYLNSSDLDECHGITSAITAENGTSYITYHYVMTYDFPYSISCYRGKPADLTKQNPTDSQTPGTESSPPQAAIDACKMYSVGTSCSFEISGGTTYAMVTGICQQTTSGIACLPRS